MTREEIIEVLKDWDGYFIRHSSDDVNEALNIAIKALEHPEKNVVAVVPCGDAISRQAVLDLLCKNVYCDNIYPAVKDLPSVTPTRKAGKWVRVDKTKVKCSECEITHLIAQYPHGSANFCPNCGADMRGDNNG